MTLQFEPISLERQSAYLDLLRQCPQKASDYSFSNLWGWSEQYDLTWAWHDDMVCIQQTRPKPCYWAPVGPWNTIPWEDTCEQHFEPGTVFTRVPEKLMNIWLNVFGDRFLIEEERDNWDYLYDYTELVELRGNRFHKKKNLLKQFLKKYDHTFVLFKPELIDAAMAMQADWCTWRNCESSDVLSAENRAVTKVFEAWEHLEGLTGGAIFVEDMIAAYTVAEFFTEDTVVIHYEKGCPEFKGVYQAINQLFLAHLPEGFETVNREQDLGEKGLRKAKLSYNPVGFLKKYRVTIK